jgi:hypothetical protein
MLQLFTQPGVLVRFQLDLCNAFAIAQIDEDDPALIANRVDPPHERNGRTEVGFGELGTVVGALRHGKSDR